MLGGYSKSTSRAPIVQAVATVKALGNTTIHGRTYPEKNRDGMSDVRCADDTQSGGVRKPCQTSVALCPLQWWLDQLEIYEPTIALAKTCNPDAPEWVSAAGIKPGTS